MKLLLTLSGFFLSASVLAQQVTWVADGDTLTILEKNGPKVVRLAGIDAPELGQRFGERARQQLEALCKAKTVRIEPQDVDQLGRTVAVVYCNGVNVNYEMVEHGFAWVNDRHSLTMELMGILMDAQDMQRGLWEDPDPMPPWEYRKRSKQAEVKSAAKPGSRTP